MLRMPRVAVRQTVRFRYSVELLWRLECARACTMEGFRSTCGLGPDRPCCAYFRTRLTSREPPLGGEGRGEFIHGNEGKKMPKAFQTL